MTSIFLYSFIFVGLKSFQQLNVQHGKYLLIAPTSFAMAFVEVGIILSVVSQKSWYTAIPLGAGASLGCMVAMFLHGRIRNESNRTVSAGKLSTYRAARIWSGCATGDD